MGTVDIVGQLKWKNGWYVMSDEGEGCLWGRGVDLPREALCAKRRPREGKRRGRSGAAASRGSSPPYLYLRGERNARRVR